MFVQNPATPELLGGSAKLKICVTKIVPFSFAASFPGETLFDAGSEVVIWVVVATIMGDIKLFHLCEGKWVVVG